MDTHSCIFVRIRGFCSWWVHSWNGALRLAGRESEGLLRSRQPRRWGHYCRSYSPLPTRLSTVNPAFLASEIESVLGELKGDHTLRTGFLHSGHLVKGGADRGRRKVNFPPHIAQFPSQSSYSYRGMAVSLCFTFQSAAA